MMDFLWHLIEPSEKVCLFFVNLQWEFAERCLPWSTLILLCRSRDTEQVLGLAQAPVPCSSESASGLPLCNTWPSWLALTWFCLAVGCLKSSCILSEGRNLNVLPEYLVECFIWRMCSAFPEKRSFTEVHCKKVKKFLTSPCFLQ